MKKNFYIYLDPRRSGHYCYSSTCFLYEPIYVGKGQGKRYLNHLQNFKNHTNGHFKNKISKILQEGFTRLDLENHILILRENITEKEALNLEKQLIEEVGRSHLNSGPLVNICEGGSGGSPMKGFRHSEQTKRRISEANKGKVRSAETKAKLSEAKRGSNHWIFGRHHPKEVREKISQSNLGKQPTAEV